MQPLKVRDYYERRSCGHELVERVGRICNTRGGLKSYPVHGRVRRGIVNECCERKCADHHIYSYCSNGDRVVVPSPWDSWRNKPAEFSDYEMKPEPLALIRTMTYVDETNEPHSIETSTISTTSSTTTTPSTTTTSSHGNHRIDSFTLNRILENLDRQEHNDFQVGTVPPEYRIMPMLPSRSRIMY